MRCEVTARRTQRVSAARAEALLSSSEYSYRKNEPFKGDEHKYGNVETTEGRTGDYPARPSAFGPYLLLAAGAIPSDERRLACGFGAEPWQGDDTIDELGLIL